MKTKTVILAGNYRCAWQIAWNRKLDYTQWVCARHDNIHGLRKPDVLVAACWHTTVSGALQDEVMETLTPQDPQLYRIECP